MTDESVIHVMNAFDFGSALSGTREGDGLYARGAVSNGAIVFEDITRFCICF